MLTDEVGVEQEYVLVGLVIVCLVGLAVRRSSRLSIHRSAIRSAAVRKLFVGALKLLLINHVLDHSGVPLVDRMGDLMILRRLC